MNSKHIQGAPFPLCVSHFFSLSDMKSGILFFAFRIRARTSLIKSHGFLIHLYPSYISFLNISPSHLSTGIPTAVFFPLFFVFLSFISSNLFSSFLFFFYSLIIFCSPAIIPTLHPPSDSSSPHSSSLMSKNLKSY